MLRVVNRRSTLVPDYVLASDYSTLGDLSFRLGRFSEAADWYKRALEAVPENESAIVGLARIRYQQGRKDEAINFLENASITQPSSLAVLGSLYLGSGRLDDAEVVLRQSVTGTGVDSNLAAWVHSMLAQVSAQRGDYWSARWYLEQATLLSAEVSYWIYLAELSARFGYTKHAIDLYREAKQLDWAGRYESQINSGLKALGVVTP